MSKESTFYRMLVISLFLHAVFLLILSTPIKKHGKRLDFPLTYSVNLVSSLGYEDGTAKKTEKEAQKIPQAEKAKPVVGQKKVAKRELSRKPLEEKSISKKKVEHRGVTKEELSSLEERIRELKAKNRYLDVGHSEKGILSKDTRPEAIAGLPGVTSGSSSSFDPSTHLYMAEVWNRVKKAWAVPSGLGIKNLETIVIVKIRKDGRIVDMEIEKRSGNRIYDESVLRTLRSVDPFPPFPQSVSVDYIEIGFRFLPGDLS